MGSPRVFKDEHALPVCDDTVRQVVPDRVHVLKLKVLQAVIVYVWIGCIPCFACTSPETKRLSRLSPTGTPYLE